MKLKTILLLILVMFTVFTVYLQWHGLHHHGLLDRHGGDCCACLLFMSLTMFAIVVSEYVRLHMPAMNGVTLNCIRNTSDGYTAKDPPFSARPGYSHALFCRPPPFFC